MLTEELYICLSVSESPFYSLIQIPYHVFDFLSVIFIVEAVIAVQHKAVTALITRDGQLRGQDIVIIQPCPAVGVRTRFVGGNTDIERQPVMSIRIEPILQAVLKGQRGIIQ